MSVTAEQKQSTKLETYGYLKDLGLGVPKQHPKFKHSAVIIKLMILNVMYTGRLCHGISCDFINIIVYFAVPFFGILETPSQVDLEQRFSIRGDLSLRRHSVVAEVVFEQADARDAAKQPTMQKTTPLPLHQELLGSKCQQCQG